MCVPGGGGFMCLLGGPVYLHVASRPWAVRSESRGCQLSDQPLVPRGLHISVHLLLVCLGVRVLFTERPWVPLLVPGMGVTIMLKRAEAGASSLGSHLSSSSPW